MRALRRGKCGARGERWPGAGAGYRWGVGGTGAGRDAAGGHGFSGRNAPARPVRLDWFGFLTAGGDPSTV